MNAANRSSDNVTVDFGGAPDGTRFFRRMHPGEIWQLAPGGGVFVTNRNGKLLRCQLKAGVYCETEMRPHERLPDDFNVTGLESGDFKVTPTWRG